MEGLLKWFDREIEIARSVGPIGHVVVLTLTQGRKKLVKLMKEGNNG